MRPFRAFFLPDMWNDWHWLIFDAKNCCVAKSSRGYFHLSTAQDEAEAVIYGLLA